jgi:hypothetical protein
LKIAFIGKMFSGKTTAADYLTEFHGYERLAFAKPVKNLAAEILSLVESRIGGSAVSMIKFKGLPTEQEVIDLKDKIKKEYHSHKPIVLTDGMSIERLPSRVWTFSDVEQKKGHPAVRKLLQLVGTELGRDLIGYEDVWVDQLLSAAQNVENVVVDDCRFVNEAEALRENGFVLVRVTRPEEDRLAMMQTRYPANFDEILNHPSELALDGFEANVTWYAESVDELLERVEQLITTES